MHTFELTSPEISIFLGFLCIKLVFACSHSGLFHLRHLFAPVICLEIVQQIRDLRDDYLNF